MITYNTFSQPSLAPNIYNVSTGLTLGIVFGKEYKKNNASAVILYFESCTLQVKLKIRIQIIQKNKIKK